MDVRVRRNDVRLTEQQEAAGSRACPVDGVVVDLDVGRLGLEAVDVAPVDRVAADAER